jgi:hypothetical protein
MTRYSQAPHSKFTEETCRAIVDGVRGGKRPEEAAEEAGVTWDAVRRWHRRGAYLDECGTTADESPQVKFYLDLEAADQERLERLGDA